MQKSEVDGKLSNVTSRWKAGMKEDVARGSSKAAKNIKSVKTSFKTTPKHSNHILRSPTILYAPFNFAKNPLQSKRRRADLEGSANCTKGCLDYASTLLFVRILLRSELFSLDIWLQNQYFSRREVKISEEWCSLFANLSAYLIPTYAALHLMKAER